MDRSKVESMDRVDRWLLELSRVEKMRRSRLQVQEALKRTGNFDLLLKTVDWNTLNQLAIFLASFRSRGNSVGLSVVPLIRAKVAAACDTSDSDCEPNLHF